MLLIIAANQLIYAAIVPVIFFHAGFSEDSYKVLESKDDTSEIHIAGQDPDTDLYGWRAGKNEKRILLYFGGDSVDTSKWLEEVYQYSDSSFFEPFTLLTVDYPTFGKSRGIISESKFYRTAERLYNYAIEKYPDAKIYAMGYSIGASAALQLSTNVSLDGLILVAPMYDGTTMYFPRGSLLHDTFEQIATVQMQNDEYAKNSYSNCLVIASKTDRMTKLDDINALCDLFQTKPDIFILEACGHGEYWKQSDTYSAVTNYFDAETIE